MRFEVFKRDLFTCRYCGRKPPDVLLVIDHVVPVCEGGSSDVDNLTTACDPCNAGKGGRPLGDVAPVLDEMAVLENMQEMLERRSILRKEILTAKARRESEDEAIEQIGQWWQELIDGEYWPNQDSLRTFIRKGLGMDEILQAIETTSASRYKIRKDWQVPNYFYGVCWRRITELEEESATPGAVA